MRGCRFVRQSNAEAYKLSDKESRNAHFNGYVPAALGKGSINLVSGFEKTRYLLLHHKTERIFVQLKGEGPKFFPKTVLEDMGFSPEGDYYLGFEIKDFEPVAGIDPDKIRSLNRRKFTSHPYFTTLRELLSE